jgi:hypothetical protein
VSWIGPAWLTVRLPVQLLPELSVTVTGVLAPSW